jgi:hypothetical protein
MVRTFTGQIEELDLGVTFVVVTVVSGEPLVTHARAVFQVLSHEEQWVVAMERRASDDEQQDLPVFETHTTLQGAPLFRVPSRSA